MLKKILTIIAIILSISNCYAEDIHFDNDVYTLKYSAVVSENNGYGNEYFKKNENTANWTKMIGIYYYPDENNPIKFAENFVKTIENTDNSVLLKFIENKKSDKAAISFLVNGSENAKKYFEYDIYKFEKHPNKGMLLLKYSVKYFFTNEEQIKQIAKNVKENNDKYLEMIISSPIPPVVEKDIKIGQ